MKQDLSEFIKSERERLAQFEAMWVAGEVDV
jgi:hypothetical protein